MWGGDGASDLDRGRTDPRRRECLARILRDGRSHRREVGVVRATEVDTAKVGEGVGGFDPIGEEKTDCAASAQAVTPEAVALVLSPGRDDRR